MNEVLVDIGVIVEYLKTGQGLLPKVYESYKMKIVASTYSELLASKTFEDDTLEKEVMDFVKKYFEIVPVDEEIALHAAGIIRSESLTLAQATLAAAARKMGVQIVTDEDKTFKDIEEVEVWSEESN